MWIILQGNFKLNMYFMTLFILGLNSTVAFPNFFEEIKVREYLSSEKEIARRLFLNSNWKLAKSYDEV